MGSTNDYPSLSRCLTCSGYNNTFFVHDQFGDYLCKDCEEPGDVVILCVACKRKRWLLNWDEFKSYMSLIPLVKIEFYTKVI